MKEMATMYGAGDGEDLTAEEINKMPYSDFVKSVAPSFLKDVVEMELESKPDSDRLTSVLKSIENNKIDPREVFTKESLNAIILNEMASGEGSSYKNPYDAMNRGKSDDTKEGVGPKLSTMTLADLMALQAKPEKDKDRVFAAGRFQIIPSTLSSVIADWNKFYKEKLDIKTQLFDKSFQDKAANLLLRRRLDFFLRNPRAAVEQALEQLAREWASVPNTKGVSHYGKAGKNAAKGGISRSRRIMSLLRMLKQVGHFSEEPSQEESLPQKPLENNKNSQENTLSNQILG